LPAALGGTLYIGVTNDLIRSVAEHRLKLVEGLTEKYEIARLVYFEQFDDVENAIKREKRLKKWPRAWKISLIEKDFPIRLIATPGGNGWASGYWVARSKPGDDSVVESANTSS
jgi:putative endonuclease